MVGERADAESSSAAIVGSSTVAGINGFSSAIIRLPEPNVTAIVLANNESVNASAMGRDLLALFYGERYTLPRAAD